MKQYIFSIFLFSFLLFGCTKDAEFNENIPIMKLKDNFEATNAGTLLDVEILNKFDSKEAIDFGFFLESTIFNSKLSLKGKKDLSDFSVRITKGLKAREEYSVKPYIETKDNFIYGEEKIFRNLSDLFPSIQKMTPTSGYVGTVFTIKGTDLLSDLGEANVTVSNYFDKSEIYQAEVIKATNETLEFRIPNMILSEERAIITVSILDAKSEIFFNVVKP